MQLRLGAGVFTPRLWPTLLTLIMLPVLLGLGTWQLHRLHWKQHLIAVISERIHNAPIEVPTAIGDVDYRHAHVSGIFRHDLEHYVFAASAETGQGGYHVVTPLQLNDGQILLIDRGWIPYSMKGQDFKRPSGFLQISGVLRAPKSPGFLQPKNDPAKGDWYSVDIPTISAVDKIDHVLPYILEVGVTANDGGYPTGGQTRLTLPSNHLSYAVTWYSFALILLVIYGLSGWTRQPAD